MKVFKYSVILIYLIAITAYLNADIYINGTNIEMNKNVNFLKLIWENKGRNKPSEVNVSYGDNRNFLPGKGIMTWRTGRKLKFRTIHEVLNHMRKSGWKDVSSFIKCSAGQAFYHFLFKK